MKQNQHFTQLKRILYERGIAVSRDPLDRLLKERTIDTSLDYQLDETLTRHGIFVEGGDGHVGLNYNARKKEITLVFEGICSLDAMRDAKMQLSNKIPELTPDMFGVRDHALSLSIPRHLYAKVTGQKFIDEQAAALSR